ncbi:MAG: hypothetical protein ACOYLQ_16535 [Hyphomicrobiaceae bacterium]
MSTELGITAGVGDHEDLQVYMKRARVERARAFAELFGFGFATAKKMVRDAAETVQSKPVSSRPA